MDFARYSKLIAGIVGNVVGIFLGWLAVSMPTIATCATGTDGVEVCTALGFSQAQITIALMIIINAAFIERSPKNTP